MTPGQVRTRIETRRQRRADEAWEIDRQAHEARQVARQSAVVNNRSTWRLGQGPGNIAAHYGIAMSMHRRPRRKK